MKTRARTISYFLSIIAVAAIFFSVEFITEKYLYPNDEVVDILAAIIGALLPHPAKARALRERMEAWVSAGRRQ